MTTFDKAPAPPQKGTMLDIFNIIKANHGPTNLAGIINAYNRDASLPRPTVQQMQTSLSNMVYRGYLTVDKSHDDHRWIIAPKSYWRARHTKIKAAYEASKLKKKKHDLYIKAKAKKARKKVAVRKVSFTPKTNGLLRSVDIQIASLSAQERGIHNKIDKLRKVRANIAMLEL